MSDGIPTLAETQDVEVGFYVLVPFTTVEGALWGAGRISAWFDCHVVGIDAVAQDTPDYTKGELRGDADD